MRNVVPVSPSVACAQEVAACLRRDLPAGWSVHDCCVGEEQVNVVGVLPRGIFAMECTAYTGQVATYSANTSRSPASISSICVDVTRPIFSVRKRLSTATS